MASLSRCFWLSFYLLQLNTASASRLLDKWDKKNLSVSLCCCSSQFPPYKRTGVSCPAELRLWWMKRWKEMVCPFLAEAGAACTCLLFLVFLPSGMFHNRSLETALAGKHWHLTWAHRLTKNPVKLGIPASTLHLLLCSESFRSTATLKSRNAW